MYLHILQLFKGSFYTSLIYFFSRIKNHIKTKSLIICKVRYQRFINYSQICIIGAIKIWYFNKHVSLKRWQVFVPFYIKKNYKYFIIKFRTETLQVISHKCSKCANIYYFYGKQNWVNVTVKHLMFLKFSFHILQLLLKDLWSIFFPKKISA